jgi:hypothetical protein
VTLVNTVEMAYSTMLARKKNQETFKEHLVKAKLERNYYDEISRKQRKLVDEHFIKLIIAALTLLAHYSYD